MAGEVAPLPLDGIGAHHPVAHAERRMLDVDQEHVGQQMRDVGRIDIDPARHGALAPAQRPVVVELLDRREVTR